MPQEKEPLILADGHVHLHDCFDRQAFFNAALSNFYLAATREGAEASYQSVLFLTESQGRETFPLFSQSGPVIERPAARLVFPEDPGSGLPGRPERAWTGAVTDRRVSDCDR